MFRVTLPTLFPTGSSRDCNDKVLEFKQPGGAKNVGNFRNNGEDVPMGNE